MMSAHPTPPPPPLDAIVIGTGPGGATVAKELSAAGRRVLILEAGSDAPVDDSPWSQLRATRAHFIGRAIPVVRGITLGGTSMLYYGCAFPPPLDLFRAHGIDLAQEVAEIRQELPVGPLPERAIGARARRIRESARDLGYAWHELDKFVHPEKCEVGVPHDAKWNARAYVREAQRHGAVVETGAVARQVLVEDGAAIGVAFTVRGADRKAYAKTIVVAAGGIGSAILLRRSGIPEAGNGFFCDPLLVVNGTVDDVSGPPEAPMAAGIHLKDDGYLMTDLTQPWHAYAPLTIAALRPDRLFAHSRTLSIMVKGRDSIGGRITERGRVRRVFPKEDLDKLRHGQARAEAILKRAGARHIFRTWYVAAHPGGSVRVGEVLDANLRTRFENLYVCDCSVIPEPWGLPPTYSLIALGKRLARHVTS